MAARKFEINKLTKGFPSLVNPEPIPPHSTPASSEVSHNRLIVMSKPTRKWERWIVQWRLHQAQQQIDNAAIQQAIKHAMIDSGATSNFIQSGQGLKQIGPTNMIVRAANGSMMQATSKVKLPSTQLNQQAKQATVIPDLNAEALLSVRQLADSGYTTIFHPHNQGVTVHDANSLKIATDMPALLQGWRSNGGLWIISLQDNANITQGHANQETAMNIYELPTT